MIYLIKINESWTILAALLATVYCRKGTFDFTNGQDQKLPSDVFPVRARQESPDTMLITWDLHGYIPRDWFLSVYEGPQKHHVFTSRISSETREQIIKVVPGFTYSVQLSTNSVNSGKLKAIPVIFTSDPPVLSDGNDNQIDYNSSMAVEDSTKGTNVIMGVLTYALYVIGPTLGFMLFICIALVTHHKMQKHSDKLILRRDSKRASAKKLVTDTDHTDTDGGEKGTTEGAVQEGGQPGPSSNNLLQPPSYLSVSPQKDVRETMYSIASWGSEFDTGDQGDGIYSNSTSLPPHSRSVSRMFNNGTNQDAIYSNQSATNTLPIRTAAWDPTAANHFPMNDRSPIQQNSWNTNQNLDRVISPQTSGTGAVGNYSNTQIDGPNALYANTGPC